MSADGRQDRIDAALQLAVSRLMGSEITGEALSDVAQEVSDAVGVPVIVVLAPHSPLGVLAYPLPSART